MREFVSKTLTVIILFAFTFAANSQTWRKDFKSHLDQGIKLAKNDPEKAVNHVLEAFELAKDHQHYWSVSLAKNTMGYISNEQRDYAAAFINYTEALEFIQKADTLDLYNEMVIYKQLAKIQGKYKNYQDAIMLYQKSNEVAKAYVKQYPERAKSEGHLKYLIDLPYYAALLQRDKGDYEAAGKTLLGLWERSEDQKNVAAYARVLNQLGLIQKRAGDYEEAEQYFGMVIGAEEVKPKMKAIAMHNMGAMFLVAKQHDKAQSYFGRALELKKEHSSKRSQFITYLDMGELAYTTGRIKEAASWWEEGLKVFDKVEGEPDLFEVYNWLQKAYLQLDPEKVLAFNEKYASLNKAWRDEQQKQQAQNSLFALQSEVNALKLEKEEAYAQKQLMKVYLPLAIGVLVTVVALILIVIRIRTVRRARADIKEAEAIMERIK